MPLGRNMGASLRDRAFALRAVPIFVVTALRASIASAMRHPVRTAALSYLAVAILTFGRAAGGEHHCVDLNDKVRECRTVSIAGGAFFAGAFWPLYWSWEAQS